MDWSCRKSGIVQAEQHWQSHVRAKSVCDLFNDRLLNVRFRHPGMLCLFGHKAQKAASEANNPV